VQRAFSSGTKAVEVLQGARLGCGRIEQGLKKAEVL
jgi:hypothetical protein